MNMHSVETTEILSDSYRYILEYFFPFKTNSKSRPKDANHSAELSEKEELEQLTRSLKQFVVEVVIGSALFLSIALFAVVISYMVRYFEGLGVNEIIIYALTGFEYLIFIVDLILAVTFIFKSSYKVARDLW